MFFDQMSPSSCYYSDGTGSEPLQTRENMMRTTRGVLDDASSALLHHQLHSDHFYDYGTRSNDSNSGYRRPIQTPRTPQQIAMMGNRAGGDLPVGVATPSSGPRGGPYEYVAPARHAQASSTTTLTPASYAAYLHSLSADDGNKLCRAERRRRDGAGLISTDSHFDPTMPFSEVKHIAREGDKTVISWAVDLRRRSSSASKQKQKQWNFDTRIERPEHSRHHGMSMRAHVPMTATAAISSSKKGERQTSPAMGSTPRRYYTPRLNAVTQHSGTPNAQRVELAIRNSQDLISLLRHRHGILEDGPNNNKTHSSADTSHSHPYRMTDLSFLPEDDNWRHGAAADVDLSPPSSTTSEEQRGEDVHDEEVGGHRPATQRLRCGSARARKNKQHTNEHSHHPCDGSPRESSKSPSISNQPQQRSASSALDEMRSALTRVVDEHPSLTRL